MKFRDNRVTMVKDEMPSPDTIKQMLNTDLDVRATPRMIAAKPSSRARFRKQYNRTSSRGSRPRKRLGGVALAEKPWKVTPDDAA